MTNGNQKAIDYLDYLQREFYETGRKRFWLEDGYKEQSMLYQKAYYDSIPADVQSESFEEYVARMEEEELKTLYPYQNPMWYSLIASYAEKIEAVLATKKETMPDPMPIFGTLPTGNFYARACSAPETEQKVIIIDEGIFGFCNLAAKAVVSCIPLTVDGEVGTFSLHGEDWKNEVASNPESRNRFLDLLTSHVVRGDPHSAKQYYPDYRIDQMSSDLRDSMEAFVMCHEYGHILLGHLNSEIVGKSMIGNILVDEILPSWDNEFEADYKGFDLLIPTLGNGDLPLAFAGATGAMKCMEIIHRATRLTSFGKSDEKPSRSHPVPSSRIKNIHTIFRSWLPEHMFNNAIKLSTAVCSVLDELWLSCEPELRRVYKRGYP